jgi:hypothetical protein
VCLTPLLKILHLQHLSAECRLLLKTAKNLVEVNVLEDDYRVEVFPFDGQIVGIDG